MNIDQQYLQSIKDQFHIEILEADPEHVLSVMPASDDLRNSMGLIYGGLVFHLMDLTCGCAFMAQGYFGPTVNADVHYMRSTQNTRNLYCEARVDRAGSTLAFAHAIVKNDQGVITTKGDFTFSIFTKDGKPIR